jgi:hypothetical protein
MNTFFEEWKSYRQRVMPPTAGPVQILETKRAFYAGAQSFLALSSKLMSDGDAVNPDDIRAIARIHAELSEFGLAGGIDEH